MSRATAAPKALASVLDRLLDADPGSARSAPGGASGGLSDLRSAVRRDLEHLLNARRPWWAPTAPALRSSLLGYGLLDFTSGALNQPQNREALRSEIAETIRRFEPRLTQVVVDFVGVPSPLQSTLRLRISALLRTDPAPEPISFDTTFESSTSDVVVRSERG